MSLMKEIGKMLTECSLSISATRMISESQAMAKAHPHRGPPLLKLAELWQGIEIAPFLHFPLSPQLTLKGFVFNSPPPTPLTLLFPYL